MNRTARNHNVDLWGQSTGLPPIHIGNYMNLNNNSQTILTNTAVDYGETIHKPRGGPVVEKDKKLQLDRQKEKQREIELDAKRFENNITNPRVNFYGSDKLYNK